MVIKGQKINDRYEIIRSIGEGGMANVYLAYDTILDRDVAIKILRGDLASDEKFVRRFQREALSASSLSHPNIVEMYDVGEDNGNYFIVMEYIEGKTLKQLLKKRGCLTLSEAIDIMLQLTDGMSHAHDSYIIHRDLKPQNIMISDDGGIKITDFGVAMALNETQLTQTNSVMGTVHYLPPEQASGKGSTIRSDIYSMGIIFYELLTGILPFKGESAVEIALKHMRDPLPSVRKQNPAIPQSIENIILKATAKNPKNRYLDAKAMHQDLLTALSDERMNEAKYIYPYPEQDMDDTKVLPTIKEKKITEDSLENSIATPIDEDNSIKKTNRWIWILSGILGVIIVVIAAIFLVIPALTEVPDVRVPQVKGLSVVEAEEKLKKAGFNVAVEIERIEDETEKGKVVKTEPSEGRSIKKGSTIKIYESLGMETYEIEDYTGQNYIAVKTLLESVHKLKVTVEKKEVEPKEGEEEKEYNEQEIVGQSVKAGTKVVEGDEIILYIPDIFEAYPDMKAEGWTLEDVEAFAKKYNLILTVEYEENSQFAKGMVIRQSRAPKTPISPDASLKVVIAKESTSKNPTGDPNLDDLIPNEPGMGSSNTDDDKNQTDKKE